MSSPATDLEELKKRHDLLWKNVEYCVKRIDVLTVSVCGAGIYTSFELLKFIPYADKWKFPYAIFATEEVKFSGICFLTGIVLNFLGQVLAFHSNYGALRHTICEIEVVRNTIASNPHTLKWYNRYNKWAQLSTNISLIAMSLALIILVSILVNYF